MSVNSFIPKINNQDWTNRTFLAPAGLVPGQRVLLATSDLLANNNGQRALNVNISFDDVVPNQWGASFELSFVVEGRDSAGNWFDIGYQFTGFRQLQVAPRRRLVIDPNVDTFNDGIPSIVYVAGDELTRISRQRGIVPPDGFRISLYLRDLNPGPSGFQQATCSVSGEKYDA